MNYQSKSLNFILWYLRRCWKLQMICWSWMSYMNPPSSIIFVNDIFKTKSVLLRLIELTIIDTYVGPIVIAGEVISKLNWLDTVNPFQKLPLYDDVIIHQYRKTQDTQMPTHIFQLAGTSYEDMLSTGHCQVSCFLIFLRQARVFSSLGKVERERYSDSNLHKVRT